MYDAKRKFHVNFRSLHSRSLLGGLLAAVLLFMVTPADAWSLKNFFTADKGVDIWRAPGQYVKIVDQDWDRDKRRAPPNQHPVNLNPHDIAVVLASLRAVDPEGSAGSSVPIFTTNEISVLSGKLAEALSRAKPEEDVVFAVVDTHKELGSNNRRSTAGRMFMLEGRLNIIFGDLLTPVTDIDDTGSGDISYYARPHSAGRRMERLDRSISVNSGPGIAYHMILDHPRPDWVGVDVPAAMAAYKGPPVPVAAAPIAARPAAAGAAPDDREQLLRERRQMLEEMARMKKALQEKEQQGANTTAPAAGMQQIPKGSSGTTGGGTNDNTLEHRLTILKSLYEKKLITSEEYEAKRKEILGDL